MELVKEGCEAHHRANTNLPDSGVCTEAELTEIYACISDVRAKARAHKRPRLGGALFRHFRAFRA